MNSAAFAASFFFIFEHSWTPKRSWKIFHGVLESPGKGTVSKRVSNVPERYGCVFASVPGDLDGRRIQANGEKASAKFCHVERLIAANGCGAPFTWIFIRPPWAATGACCKECVYNEMNIYASKVTVRTWPVPKIPFGFFVGLSSNGKHETMWII